MLPQKTILLVDDEEMILDLSARYIENAGYKIKMAISGNKALEIINNSRIDLIISDIGMCDGSGIELLDKLNQATEQPPQIIFLTGFSNKPEEELISLGALAVLHKPIDYEILLQKIFLYFNSTNTLDKAE